MLTVRFDQLGVRPGDLVLDMGCGAGRHAFESYRRGARVVAFDYLASELKDVAGLFAAMRESGEAGTAAGSLAATANGDALALPFPDDTFDRVIASEVLEHVSDDLVALEEIFRVLKPGGTLAATVPAWLPEQVCWALSSEYHAPFVEGGHVRIFSEPQLRHRMRDAGLRPRGAHHAHALHSPYWWLKCAVGPTNDDHPLVKAYLKLLVWDITGTQPVATVTKLAERVLNPVLGKSLVVYAEKPTGKG
ncbi:MAG: methyltransferase domain-containing protein [Actinomycetota bacterium]|nr:methyltransferase domain-containing protein [Actinomycetota bacterium]